MEHIKLVIFDMDGLLFDTEPVYYRAFKRSAEKLGYEVSFDTYLKCVGVTDETGKEIMAGIYGKNAQILQVFDHYQEEFKKIIDEEGISVKPGVEELLDVLDQKEIKKCIASSSARETIEKNVKVTGLENRFDFYVSGLEVKNGKPAPDIFLEAARRGNVRPDEAIVFEDSRHGLEAAVAADIPCIIVPDLIEPDEEMRRKAFKIISDLSQAAELFRKS